MAVWTQAAEVRRVEGETGPVEAGLQVEGELGKGVGPFYWYCEFSDLLSRSLLLTCLPPTLSPAQVLAWVSTFSPIAHFSLFQGSAFLTYTNSTGTEAFLSGGIGTEHAYKPSTVEKSTRVVVRNLPAECDEGELKRTLEQFGLVVYCKLLRGREDLSLSCGFAQFYQAAQAHSFVAAFNGLKVGRKALEAYSIEDFHPVSKCLYIHNFHPNTTEGQLFTYFSRYGPILSTSLKETLHRKFACVAFATREAAAKAICDANGRLVEGHSLTVTYFESQKERYGGLNRVWEERNVLLFGLPKAANEKEVRIVCERFGAIQSMKVQKSAGKVTGFVCFETRSAAAEALSREIEVLGVKVRATRWVQKEDIRGSVEKEQSHQPKEGTASIPYGFRCASAQLFSGIHREK